eukprot:CAMPEP_0167824522 /NCGR_PEP_ID=MMETSP0112_2-20121227/8836_1 /TAXON_ID=91324 /ORGANISM="Lotharella globosa, Strain CCCM811" /LENGTH=781 /DNA_ID=CAMNT_0007726485 /DNA_START=24 /DNA_END=2370 /DNA_ORIENTATION=+
MGERDQEGMIPWAASIKAGNALLAELTQKSKDFLSIEQKFIDESNSVLQSCRDEHKGAMKLCHIWQVQIWLLLRKCIAASSRVKSRRLRKLPEMSNKALFDLLFPKETQRRSVDKVPALPRLKRRNRELDVTNDLLTAARSGCIACMRHLVARNDKDAMEKAHQSETRIAKMARQLKRLEEPNSMLSSALSQKTKAEQQKQLAPSSSKGGTTEDSKIDAEVIRLYREEIQTLRRKLEECKKVAESEALRANDQSAKASRLMSGEAGLNEFIKEEHESAVQKQKDLLKNEVEAHRVTKALLNQARDKLANHIRCSRLDDDLEVEEESDIKGAEKEDDNDHICQNCQRLKGLLDDRKCAETVSEEERLVEFELSSMFSAKLSHMDQHYQAEKNKLISKYSMEIEEMESKIFDLEAKLSMKENSTHHQQQEEILSQIEQQDQLMSDQEEERNGDYDAHAASEDDGEEEERVLWCAEEHQRPRQRSVEAAKEDEDQKDTSSRRDLANKYEEQIKSMIKSHQQKIEEVRSLCQAKIQRIKKECEAELEEKAAAMAAAKSVHRRRTTQRHDKAIAELKKDFRAKEDEMNKNYLNTRRMMAEYMKKMSVEKLRRKKMEQKVELYQKEISHEKARRRQLEARFQNLDDSRDSSSKKERAMVVKEKADLKAYIVRSKEIQAQLREEKDMLENEKKSFKTYMKNVEAQRSAASSPTNFGMFAANDTSKQALMEENTDLKEQLRVAKEKIALVFQKGREAELTTVAYIQKYNRLEEEMKELRRTKGVATAAQ